MIHGTNDESDGCWELLHTGKRSKNGGKCDKNQSIFDVGRDHMGYYSKIRITLLEFWDSKRRSASSKTISVSDARWCKHIKLYGDTKQTITSYRPYQLKNFKKLSPYPK